MALPTSFSTASHVSRPGKSAIRYVSRPAKVRRRPKYAIKLRQLLDFYGVDQKQLEEAIISSVVSPLTEILRSTIR